MLRLKKLVLFVIATAIAQNSYSFEMCSQQALNQQNMQKAGFFLSKNIIGILKSNRPLDRNKGVTQAQAEQRILTSIKKSRNTISTIEDSRLANLLSTASKVVGVDFQQLSSMVKKETHYCMDRTNNTNSGASGCTQFTTIALKELKDQFGYKGTKNHTKSAEAEKVLRGFAKTYFAAFPNPTVREAAFYAWLGSSVANMQMAFRGKGNFDIDILAGALLLKIYLATNGGNYYKALVQYNGDPSRKKLKNGKRSQPYKYQYAGEVQAQAQYISMDQEACMEAVSETESMIEDSCDSFNEDPLTCVGSEPSLLPPPPPLHWT